MNILKKVQYNKLGYGHFPDMQKDIVNAFSWGNNTDNMQFTKDSSENINVRLRVQKFLNQNDFGGIRESINLNPEHSDRIIIVDKEFLERKKPTRFGIQIDCDALFTAIKGITITVKSADCTTALLIAKDPYLIGIIHTGRRGAEKQLAKKSIEFSTSEYGIKPSEIKLFILPHLFQANRKFENIDELNPKIWKDFIYKKDNYFFPGETELVLKQYHEAGVLDENITIYDVDTFEEASRGKAFSYKYWYEMRKKNVNVPQGGYIAGIRIV